MKNVKINKLLFKFLNYFAIRPRFCRKKVASWHKKNGYVLNKKPNYIAVQNIFLDFAFLIVIMALMSEIFKKTINRKSKNEIVVDDEKVFHPDCPVVPWCSDHYGAEQNRLQRV